MLANDLQVQLVVYSLCKGDGLEDVQPVLPLRRGQRAYGQFWQLQNNNCRSKQQQQEGDRERHARKLMLS